MPMQAKTKRCREVQRGLEAAAEADSHVNPLIANSNQLQGKRTAETQTQQTNSFPPLASSLLLSFPFLPFVPPHLAFIPFSASQLFHSLLVSSLTSTSSLVCVWIWIGVRCRFVLLPPPPSASASVSPSICVSFHLLLSSALPHFHNDVHLQLETQTNRNETGGQRTRFQHPLHHPLHPTDAHFHLHLYLFNRCQRN